MPRSAFRNHSRASFAPEDMSAYSNYPKKMRYNPYNASRHHRPTMPIDINFQISPLSVQMIDDVRSMSDNQRHLWWQCYRLQTEITEGLINSDQVPAFAKLSNPDAYHISVLKFMRRKFVDAGYTVGFNPPQEKNKFWFVRGPRVDGHEVSQTMNIIDNQLSPAKRARVMKHLPQNFQGQPQIQAPLSFKNAEEMNQYLDNYMNQPCCHEDGEITHNYQEHVDRTSTTAHGDSALVSEILADDDPNTGEDF